jgi:hypothetical protein
MFEFIFGLIAFFATLLVLCKFVGKLARVCGLEGAMNLIGESLAMRGGTTPRERER